MTMYKRFWIICSVVAAGLLVLSALGLSSLGMHRKGLAAERQQEFMDVAKQISFEVKKKVDAFLLQEKNRPYTDYQQYYVPQASNEAVALVQSPLVNLFSNGLANGYFQLDSEGNLVSPYFAMTQDAERHPEYAAYFKNIRQNLLPSLQNGQGLAVHRIEPAERLKEDPYSFDKAALGLARSDRQPKGIGMDNSLEAQAPTQPSRPAGKLDSSKAELPSKSRAAASRRGVYPISSLEETQQQAQVLTQNRANYEMNVDNTQMQQTAMQQPGRGDVQTGPAQSVSSQSAGQAAQEARPQTPVQQTMAQRPVATRRQQAESGQIQMGTSVAPPTQQEDESVQPLLDVQTAQSPVPQSDTVQVRIEPFVPITVSEPGGRNGIFAGRVFLLRHVQIEDRHWVQGFQLNEAELLNQVSESARRLLRRGMGYEISRQERPDAAFAAILQFDFGEIVLNLLEQEPGYIQAQVLRIRNWFFGILGVVWLSVLLAMAALWKNMREQVQLSRKKDDFISAVSHELRTPLTSIRMYTEMLEKDWVKTDTKRREYYTTMRQESERLTRLIENVLDFSRIQRGKKQYSFNLGDVNEPIRQVAELMRPCMERAGFMLVQELAQIAPFKFDRDAVMQITVNLLDNALKYARIAEDKRIFLRTRQVKDKVIIEVEDRGPGIGRSQQKKIFDAFYRCEDESTRQTTGTGLGLALVKRFAEAHRGFVEYTSAKPSGALFRVALANQVSK
jgi:signal transduction histidine kinase